jgi:hypothetical protein
MRSSNGWALLIDGRAKISTKSEQTVSNKLAKVS